MSPLPLTPAVPLPNHASFNREQITQINEFFSSTAGIVTFSLIWIFCVLGMFFLTSWILAKHEEESRKNPELARERARMGLMLINIAMKEENTDGPSDECNSRSIRPGKYSRLL